MPCRPTAPYGTSSRTAEPVHEPVSEPAQDVEQERRPVQSWEIYVIGMPLAVITGTLIWQQRHVLVGVPSGVRHFVGDYIGWSLAPYFAFLTVLLLVGVYRLRREQTGQRTPLSANAFLEFVVEVAPSAGFLGTAIGLLECLKNPEDLSGFSLALGTTILGLGLSAAARIAQFVASGRYRAELNGEDSER